MAQIEASNEKSRVRAVAGAGRINPLRSCDGVPPLEGEGAVKAEVRAARRRWAMLGAAVIASTAVTGAVAWWLESARPAPVLSDQLAYLQPELVSLIEEHVGAVRESPGNALPHASLGLVYEANELWHEAQACYEQARALQPSEPMWLHHAAIAAQHIGDYAAAMVLLREGAERFPDFAPILYRLGDLLVGQGLVDQAARAFEQTIRSAPDQSAGYVGLADVKLRQDAYGDAADLLERAIHLNPTDATAHYLLGRAYRGLGRQQEARQQLALGANTGRSFLSDAWEAGLNDFTVSITLRVQRTRQLMAVGHIDEAIRKLESILATHPDESRALRMLGPVYIKTGRLADARRVLLKAIRVDDSRAPDYINLAVCYRDMRRPRDAFRMASDAIMRFPDVWELHFQRGIAQMTLQQYAEAFDSLAEAARLNANDPSVYHTAGRVAARLQRYEEARSLFATAIARWPGYVPAHVALARVYATLGDWESAFSAMEVARTLAPQDKTVLALTERLRMRKRE